MDIELNVLLIQHKLYFIVYLGFGCRTFFVKNYIQGVDIIASDLNRTSNEVDEQNVCPGCGSSNLMFDSSRGEISCNNCGLVIEEDLIDRGQEWRAFNQEQRNKRTRTGAPMTNALADKGLSTDIDWKNRDCHGNSIPERNLPQMYRIRKWLKANH